MQALPATQNIWLQELKVTKNHLMDFEPHVVNGYNICLPLSNIFVN